MCDSLHDMEIEIRMGEVFFSLRIKVHELMFALLLLLGDGDYLSYLRDIMLK